MRKGWKVLDGCIPCQLFKSVPDAASTATLHPYGIKEAFVLWEIDFFGPLVTTNGGNAYVITAVDYATSKALAYPIVMKSAEDAAQLLEEIVWTYG